MSIFLLCACGCSSSLLILPKSSRAGGDRRWKSRCPKAREVPPPCTPADTGTGGGARRGQVAARRGPPAPGPVRGGKCQEPPAQPVPAGRNAQSDHQRAVSPTMPHLIYFCNLNFWGPPPSKPIFDIGVFSSPHPFSFEKPPPPSPSRSFSSEPRSLILDEYYFALFVGQAQLCYWR